MDKVIVIVGPTAVGKSKLSIDLAKEFNFEIISGDSMQVYRGMDIGTGKVTAEEIGAVPHYMLDILNPDEEYSVADFKEQVTEKISLINQRGSIPILVGGSGLYIQSVLFNFEFAERKRNEQVTAVLEKELEKSGNDALYKRLTKVDPIQAEKIHPNNYRRVIRALEIYETTGLTMTEYHARQKKTNKYNHVIIGLEMERTLLYGRINQRVDKMIESGLVEEVRALYNKGYTSTNAMKAIGYKEIIPYLEGVMSLDDAIIELKRNSRRYAKRQYTWFKNQMDVNWFNFNETNYESNLAKIVTFINNAFRFK